MLRWIYLIIILPLHVSIILLSAFITQVAVCLYVVSPPQGTSWQLLAPICTNRSRLTQCQKTASSSDVSQTRRPSLNKWGCYWPSLNLAPNTLPAVIFQQLCVFHPAPHPRPVKYVGSRRLHTFVVVGMGHEQLVPCCSFLSFPNYDYATNGFLLIIMIFGSCIRTE